MPDDDKPHGLMTVVPHINILIWRYAALCRGIEYLWKHQGLRIDPITVINTGKVFQAGMVWL